MPKEPKTYAKGFKVEAVRLLESSRMILFVLQSLQEVSGTGPTLAHSKDFCSEKQSTCLPYGLWPLGVNQHPRI